MQCSHDRKFRGKLEMVCRAIYMRSYRGWVLIPNKKVDFKTLILEHIGKLSDNFPSGLTSLFRVWMSPIKLQSRTAAASREERVPTLYTTTMHRFNIRSGNYEKLSQTFPSGTFILLTETQRALAANSGVYNFKRFEGISSD